MKENKFLVALILISIFMNVMKVNAKEESWYTNQYGVVFTYSEYQFLSEFYFEGYQNYMTLEEYEEFKESNIESGNIKSDTYIINNLNTREIHESNSKIIKTTASCLEDCTVSTVLTWKKSPTIRSYDVIGALLENTELVTYKSTRIYYDNTNTTISDINKKSNGFGVSLKLPTSGENISIVQTFVVKNKGSIKASYQHAKKTSTLATSKKYTLSSSGYGGVFLFDSSVKDYYDGMGGVTVKLG